MRKQKAVTYKLSNEYAIPDTPPKTQGTLYINKGDVLRGEHFKNLKVVIERGGIAEGCTFEECIVQHHAGGTVGGMVLKGVIEWHSEEKNGFTGWQWLS